MHRLLLLLFRNRPALAAELQESDLTQAAPAAYHADLVVVLRGGAGPLLGIVIEVQLRSDEGKR